MKRTILAAALLAAAVAPGHAQSVGEKTGVNSVLGIAPKTEDFVTELAISDMFEIQSSELASARSDARTKSFAQQMVADHTKTTGDLKAMIAAGTVKATPPKALDSSHQKMLDALKGLQGGDFTRQYHSDQVSAHKDAVSLFKRYADGGENPDLKAWAAKTVPTLEHHLQMAQDLAR